MSTTDNKIILDREETLKRTENQFDVLMENMGIKSHTKTYIKMQHMFFAGAATAIDEIPTRWGIGLMSGRKITGGLK